MASARKAPPRRKSCSECIKSKRRCDQVLPSCTRCIRLKLDCSYGASARSHNNPLLPSTSGTLGAPTNRVSTPSVLQEESLVASIDPSLVDIDDLGGSHLLPELDGSLSVNLDSPNLSAPAEPDHPIIRLAAEEFLFQDVSVLLDFRFKYGLEQMKAAPKVMVYEVQTPWSHPLLYGADMPQVMQDAHAACALHATRNETNSRFVVQHVTTRLQELLARPASVVPLEQLARTQALLLYCIILVFSGDIREHARAETALEHLESAAKALDPLVGIIDPIPQTLSYYPSAASSLVWRTWIFRESVRRTFLACFFFLSLYCVMKDDIGYCRNHTAFFSIWTASAHLWSARSLLDFTTVWNEKKHYVVHGLDFTDIVDNARADDVDEFGRMLLVAYMGIDDAKGWFHTRGGAL